MEKLKCLLPPSETDGNSHTLTATRARKPTFPTFGYYVRTEYPKTNLSQINRIIHKPSPHYALNTFRTPFTGNSLCMMLSSMARLLTSTVSRDVTEPSP